jgi:hypothetical protein
MANGTLAASQIEMLSQSGTGIITITPPATNSNRSLALPDSSGTVATAESTLSQFNASGSAPVYACRAWVNFNGTGTVAIRASGNVSSITDNGTGDYTVNFATAMPDADYSTSMISTGAISGTAAVPSLYSTNSAGDGAVVTTTTCRIVNCFGVNKYDTAQNHFQAFR